MARAEREMTGKGGMRTAVLRAAGLSLVFVSAGCTLLERDTEHADTGVAPALAAPERDIADDFLGALVQIEGYGPESTTVRFARDALAEDAFVAALESLMREAGYAVRVLNDAAAPGAVTHEVRTVGDEAMLETVHTVSVGEVQMRRRYTLNAAGRWEPSGSLFVRGADASGIRLDEGGEERDPPAQPVPPLESPSTRIAEAPALEADGAGSGVRDPSAARPRVAPRPAPLAFDELSGKPVYSGLVSGGRGAVRTRNIMDLGGSNYSALLDDYGNVDELILMFPNDSLTLGDDNKRMILAALERFDPDSDMFSIVGCSLGPTRLENGNQALALGRANRVKEELLFAGVPNERILDEGCWAGESTAKFPSRGVVLTHRRQSS